MINAFISYRLIPLLTSDKYAPSVNIFNMNYLNWKALKKSAIASVSYVGGVCADIGSGNSPYKKYFLPQALEYISIDNSQVNNVAFNASESFLEGDIKNLPLKDGYCDTVILTQVLEHIDDTQKAISEVHRILKKDGVLIISTPFIYQEHIAPFDYYRFSENGLRFVLKDFEIVEFHRQGYFGTAIVSQINGFLWIVASKNKTVRNVVLLPILLTIFAINNLFGILLDLIKIKEFTPNFWVIAKKK